MTKKQRKEVRRALRQYDGRGKWAAVLDRVKEYYARTDPACWELLRMRYLEGYTSAARPTTARSWKR